jgi:hypothetical protein
MKIKLLSRRKFVKQTSIGAAGTALTAGGMVSIYSGIIQDAEKPAILGGTPVRPKGSDLGVSWPVYDETDLKMHSMQHSVPWILVRVMR